MGMYDELRDICPQCGEEDDDRMQSRMGTNQLEVYKIEDCPYEMLVDLAEEIYSIPCRNCGTNYEIDPIAKKYKIIDKLYDKDGKVLTDSEILERLPRKLTFSGLSLLNVIEEHKSGSAYIEGITELKMYVNKQSGVIELSVKVLE